MARRIAPVTTRLQDGQVDQVFRNHEQRLRQLEVELDPLIGLDARLGQGAGNYTFTASSIATTQARRWFAADFSGAVVSSVAAATYVVVPPGFRVAESLSISIGVGGSPASVIISYFLTRGTPTAEVDTILRIDRPANFAGIFQVAIDAPIAPGDALRIACEKSTTAGASPTDLRAHLVWRR